TLGFQVVVDPGASHPFPRKLPRRSFRTLKSRNGSHLMIATIPPSGRSVEPSFERLALCLPRLTVADTLQIQTNAWADEIAPNREASDRQRYDAGFEFHPTI